MTTSWYIVPVADASLGRDVHRDPESSGRADPYGGRLAIGTSAHICRRTSDDTIAAERGWEHLPDRKETRHDRG